MARRAAELWLLGALVLLLGVLVVGIALIVLK